VPKYNPNFNRKREGGTLEKIDGGGVEENDRKHECRLRAMQMERMWEEN
jgi:hypothetical protein